MSCWRMEAGSCFAVGVLDEIGAVSVSGVSVLVAIDLPLTLNCTPVMDSGGMMEGYGGIQKSKDYTD